MTCRGAPREALPAGPATDLAAQTRRRLQPRCAYPSHPARLLELCGPDALLC